MFERRNPSPSGHSRMSRGQLNMLKMSNPEMGNNIDFSKDHDLKVVDSIQKYTYREEGNHAASLLSSVGAPLNPIKKTTHESLGKAMIRPYEVYLSNLSGSKSIPKPSKTTNISNNKRKNVLESDDSEEEFVSPKSTNKCDSNGVLYVDDIEDDTPDAGRRGRMTVNDGCNVADDDNNNWIDAKPTGSIPTSRPKIGKKVNARAVAVYSDEDVSSKDNSPLHTSGKLNPNTGLLSRSFLEDTPEVEKKHANAEKAREKAKIEEREERRRAIERKRKENSIKSDMNHLKKSSKSSKSSKKNKRRKIEDSDDDSSSNDSSSSDENNENDESHENWSDDMSKEAVLAEARVIVKKCDAVSSVLRKSLNQWRSSSKGDGGGDGDCTDIIAINSTTADSEYLVSHDDIQRACPGLALKAYQLVGVNWLKLLHQNGINGVLADDMGLGKTVQSIAFIGWLKDQNGSSNKEHKPHFVVVPASTLENWENELEKFCPGLNVYTYYGSMREREDMRQDIRSGIRSGDVDVVLSTYTIFEREASKDDRAFLRKIDFDYMILDEAHCLKNSESSRFVNLSQMKSSRRLLLSGTPVQNDIKELLALLSFLMPDVFRKDKCEVLLEAYNWESAASSNTTPHSGRGDLATRNVRTMLAPFVLRRRKKDVLDQLVDKETVVVRLPMTDNQKRIYHSIIQGYSNRKEKLKQKAIIEKSEAKLLDGIVTIPKDRSSSNDVLAALPFTVKSSKFFSSSGKTVDLTGAEPVVDLVDSPLVPRPRPSTAVATILRDLSPTEARSLFTALRKAANHPLLLRNRYVDPAQIELIANVTHIREHFGNQCDLQRVREELAEFSDYDLHELCMEYFDALSHLELPEEALYDSPKMVYLQEHLPLLVAQGHRVLVFSQWTKLLDLLGVLLRNQLGIKFMRLDGSTPVKERQDMINKFNRDASFGVFLLSTKAGGLGINLTAADTVIMHDLDFNPENDRQAEDRCHRIGQTRPVTVYKLVCEDTVDADIFDIGERKSAMSKAVLEDTDSASKTGQAKRAGGREGDGELSTIQLILQRALGK